MKHTLTLFGMVGLAVTLLSSYTFAQKQEEPKTTPKVRHIKMLKIEDGEKMELDTVLTNSSVFVWNGDTIGEGMFDGDEGDSIPERIIIRKRMKNGDGDPFVFMNGKGHVSFPPVPPLPPVGMHRGKQVGKVIDLNDPNIISYQKKELSGGREKIEIVRKKSEKTEEMSFGFQMDDDAITPEAPEMIKEFNHDGKNIKIREKVVKVDGKDGREVKVEVESTENK